MKRTTVAVLVVMSVVLGSGKTLAQPVTEEFRRPMNVYAILRSISEALPAPGGSLRANVVSSPRYGVRVSSEEVTVTTAFLREASIDAVAASVVCQLLPDPVYFAITMNRAGLDGPRGLAELNEQLIDDSAIERQYRAALNVAYSDMMQTIVQNNMWIFAPSGYDLMYGVMDAATARYYEALSAYEAYRAARPDLPVITAEFIRMVTEVTTTLRGGSAGVSLWHPHIQEALKAYPPPREE